MDARAPVVTMPWWRVPIMWLVIGGLAAVVVGSSAVAVLAWHGGDRPVRDASAATTDPMTPAKQARNHAATAR